jgi:hypothetical protein
MTRKEAREFFQMLADALGEETEVKEATDAKEASKEEVEKEKKAMKKTTKVKKTASENKTVADSDNDYNSMSGPELYKLCCSRGISTKIKSRKKADLIEALVALDNGEIESTGRAAKAEKAKKKPEPKPFESDEDDDEDWDDEEEKPADPYEGKKAKELYNMCVERNIKTKPRLNASEYVELLKKADSASEDEDIDDDDDDDDDEWEI